MPSNGPLPQVELRPSPHPDRPASLNSLASMLWKRFRHEGRQSDLEEAILWYKQVLNLLVSTHPLRYMSLNNLANALWTRFGEEHQQGDIDEAISLLKQALELQGSTHSDRSMSLENLAIVLLTRFWQEGRRSDLDEAISLFRHVLECQPSPHPLRSTALHNLANALRTRFVQDVHRSDRDEAILLLKQALEIQGATHFDQSMSNENLAVVLSKQFGQLEESRRCDLDAAIALLRQILERQPLCDPLQPTALHNLASALWSRFVQDVHRSDLDEAMLMHRQALELRVSPHPDQSQSLHELGKTLIYAHWITGNISDHLDEAMELFSAATKVLNQPTSLRLRIAHTWIKHAVLHRHMSAMDAYDTALQILPKLAALSSNVKLRQEALLTGSDGLARDASRFAIQAGNLDKGVEFLEAGRAIFWSQFLSLRSPFDQLQEISPELADKLRDIATALELGSYRNTLASPSENRQKLIIDQETARLNRLNEDWSKAIDEVRQLNGPFKDFLRNRRIPALQVGASEGPVIMLVGNDAGSDILILTSANVRTLPLSGLPNRELKKLVRLIQAASSDSGHPHIAALSENIPEFPPAIVETLRDWDSITLKEERGMRYAGQKDSDVIFRYVLEILWTKVVKPIIDILDLKKSEKPPVVHWCPTGLFSFLPIHAAGRYDNSLITECASEYFISSYTPTIGALLAEDQTPSTEPFKMMVVIQSRELPSTRKELEKIERHVSNDFLVKLGIPGASASIEAVASQLSDVAIVHFSCHGTQDRSSPFDSSLKLEDGYLRVSRIMKEKIRNGALAFLCACETAMGDDKLPDEAMSLAASLLFSGFRRVIATMWEMMDEDGPVVADAFYEELFRGPDGKPTREPDVSASALALHIAVKKLRAKKVSFRRWVPFIHMGK